MMTLSGCDVSHQEIKQLEPLNIIQARRLQTASIKYSNTYLNDPTRQFTGQFTSTATMESRSSPAPESSEKKLTRALTDGMFTVTTDKFTSTSTSSSPQKYTSTNNSSINDSQNIDVTPRSIFNICNKYHSFTF